MHTLDLAHSDATLDADRIVLNGDAGGAKITWILSGYNISSLKPTSDINRFVGTCAKLGVI
jgi:hypothetical protein